MIQFCFLHQDEVHNDKYVGVLNLLPDSKNIQWKDKTLFCPHSRNDSEIKL